MSIVSAFFLSGRFSVTVTTPPSRATTTSSMPVPYACGTQPVPEPRRAPHRHRRRGGGVRGDRGAGDLGALRIAARSMAHMMRDPAGSLDELEVRHIHPYQAVK